MRVRHAAKATFSVGQEVPVLGRVSYKGEKAVQSIEYHSSGVIFDVVPHIRKSTVDLAIHQQLSNFVRTDLEGLADLPKAMGSRSGENQATDILVLLQVRRIVR